MTEPEPPRKLPYAYPRAGRRGDDGLAEEAAWLLASWVNRGAPAAMIGPSLVKAFAAIYRLLPAEEAGLAKSQTPMLYALLGSGPNPLKMTKRDSAYRPKPGPGGEQSCQNCSSSYTGNATGETICSQVSGEVRLQGWCRLWNTDRH